MAQVTIEDVAKAAGVSTFTVSRALRGMDHVAPRTREKVLQAAKELNWTCTVRKHNMNLFRSSSTSMAGASTMATNKIPCVAICI